MLEADGYVTLTTNVTINAGETTQLIEDLDFAPTPTKKANAPDSGTVIAVLALALCGMAVLRRK